MRITNLVLSLTLLLGFAFGTSAQQERGIQSFRDAIRSNDLARLRALVSEYGPNVKDGTGFTPLMLAAAYGTRDAVKLLIDANADINAASNGGITALHLAWSDET